MRENFEYLKILKAYIFFSKKSSKCNVLKLVKLVFEFSRQKSLLKSPGGILVILGAIRIRMKFQNSFFLIFSALQFDDIFKRKICKLIEMDENLTCIFCKMGEFYKWDNFEFCKMKDF